jgi:hypothetical protein
MTQYRITVVLALFATVASAQRFQSGGIEATSVRAAISTTGLAITFVLTNHNAHRVSVVLAGAPSVDNDTGESADSHEVVGIGRNPISMDSGSSVSISLLFFIGQLARVSQRV